MSYIVYSKTAPDQPWAYPQALATPEQAMKFMVAARSTAKGEPLAVACKVYRPQATEANVTHIPITEWAGMSDT